MTEYELLDIAISFQDISTSHVMNFSTVLFAYLICAYLVGDRLSRIQYWVVNTIYTAFSFGAGLLAYIGQNRFITFIERALEQFPQPSVLGGGVPPVEIAFATMALIVVSYLAGLLFMLEKRRER